MSSGVMIDASMLTPGAIGFIGQDDRIRRDGKKPFAKVIDRNFSSVALVRSRTKRNHVRMCHLFDRHIFRAAVPNEGAMRLDKDFRFSVGNSTERSSAISALK